MPDYCYVKHYEQNQMGSAFLKNTLPLDAYNQSRYDLLIRQKESLDVKLQVLSEFLEICAYDIVHAIYPEPFGYFDDEGEKAELRRISILHQNFVNYLGAIYAGIHKDRGEARFIEGFPSLVIDFSEVMKIALTDYFTELYEIQRNVRIFNPKENTEPAQPIVTKSIAYTGDQFEIPSIEKGKRISRPPHAIAATYILPSLLELALSTELENSVITDWLHGMEKVKMQEDSEKAIFESFWRMHIEGHGLLTGDRRKMMIRIWDIGEKYGVLNDVDDKKKVMYGKNKYGDELTLGDILACEYTVKRIRPQYLKVMQLLFGRKNLNLRNKIAHGDQSRFDYLHIGYVAVMYQMLMDIAGGCVFANC